jgi:hypothetical protein
MKNYIEEKFNVIVYKTVENRWIANDETGWNPQYLCESRTLIGLYFKLMKR